MAKGYPIKNNDMTIQDLKDYSLILPVKRSTPRKQFNIYSKNIYERNKGKYIRVL